MTFRWGEMFSNIGKKISATGDFLGSTAKKAREMAEKAQKTLETGANIAKDISGTIKKGEDVALQGQKDLAKVWSGEQKTELKSIDAIATMAKKQETGNELTIMGLLVALIAII